MQIALKSALFGSAFGLLLTAATAMTVRADSPAAPDVLSIGGSVTEIIVALGQQHRIIARDTTSTYPPEISELPDVGYMRALSPEGVLSVAPDLIISEADAGPPEALDVIRAAHIEFIEVPEDLTVEGILQKVAVIGDALGVSDQAALLSQQIKADMSRAQKDAERPDATKKRVMFVLSTQGGKINASGMGTAADAVIRMAGGINAVTDFPGYKQITDEAVALAAPDVILMMDRDGDHSVTDADLFALPSMSLTPAAAHGAVVRIDGLKLLGFGPRTADAIRELNAALYPAEG